MGTLVLPILYYPTYKKGVEWGYGYTGTSYIVLLLL